MNLVESAQKCLVDEEMYQVFEQELQRVYHESLDQQRGDQVRFRTLLAALEDSGGLSLDYPKLLMRAVLEGWVESTDELDPKRRKVWLSEEVINPDRSWPQVKAEEEPSTNSQKAFHALHELKQDLNIVSVRGTDKLYTYNYGVWEPLADQALRETLLAYMGEDYSASIRSAVEELIHAMWSVPRERFGTPAGKLAVKNGLLDLKTRVLEPIKPEHYITERLPVEYDPDAECPQFQATLDLVIPEQEKQRTLQEFWGYCFWPEASYKRGLMNLGETDTGKSTVGRAFDQLFRPEDIAHVSPKRLQEDKYAAANLEHKMVNFVDELDRHELKKTNKIKEAISGDPMVAERKYEQAYRFKPTCKHIFASNKALQAPRADEAFWNRWITIVFEEQIPEDQQVPKNEMIARFEAEASGILNWALNGLDRLRTKGGFTIDRSIDETYQIWTDFGDDISEFVDLMIRQTKGGIVFTEDLYNAYEKYCELTGKECTLNQDQLTHEMRERGIGDYTMKWDSDTQQSKPAFENITIQNIGSGGVDRDSNI